MLPIEGLNRKNDEIISIWKDYVVNGYAEQKGLRSVIFESWKRSKKFNVNPFLKEFPIRLTSAELKNRLKKFSHLLNTAKPCMDSLYKIVKDTDFIIRITDNDGYVLKHIGSEKSVNVKEFSGSQDGYSLSEEAIGTNAVGTALFTGEAIQVVGGEHYVKQYHNMTSSACPIKNKSGEILAVLSITGKYELSHIHTLGMVIATAEAIEKELELAEYNNKLKAVNKRVYQITESISEGIIRVNNSGKIISINRFARKFLSYNESDIIGKDFRTILDKSNKSEIIKSILDGKSYEEEEVCLLTRTGRRKSCIANITPIKLHNSSPDGVIITLQELKVVHSLVNKIVGANAKFTFNDILGESDAIKNAIKLASLSANTNSTILLQGESGTGKEMFAQSIHNESDRRDYPFIFLNCGAIPRELVSSELFGYVEGAFTGAKRGGHPGKFELANGGTIFLDEIGDMPLDTQISLLRVLEDRKVIRVGGHDVIPIDVRVIAATNKDLKKEVESGNFRKDLYYRINVMSIYIPPLRERKEDIRLLIDYFIEKFCDNTGKTIKRIDESFYKGMINYDWPGNVRELQNFLQRTINVCDNNGILTAKDLPHYVNYNNEIKKNVENQQIMTLEELEKNYIEKTIDNCRGNIALTSKVLGIGRSTLYRKMKKYNIREREY